MIEIHKKYRAEFTYSDNLPEGLTCEIYSRELIDNLPEFNEKTLPLPGIIKSNINQFDIELYYRKPDLRPYRMTFRSSSPRDRAIMDSIVYIHKGIPLYEEILPIIEKNPEVLMAGPSYIDLELTGSCSLNCIYCYRDKIEERNHIEESTVETLLRKMEEFHLPYTLCLGGSGEPFEHPQFYSILQKTLDESLIERIVLETNGRGIDANFITYCAGRDTSKLEIIVNLSATNEEQYSDIHGSSGYEKVKGNVIAFKESDAKGTIYVQLLKINETEPFTDIYYDTWEKTGVPVVFQKQNTFLGEVEDRRYSDLSPLRRSHCWHLARDLNINSEGTVQFCKQDIGAGEPAGNINSHSISAIWEKQKNRFIENVKESFPDNPRCEECDEWYTFNY
jgi:spiro-SPASM protein